ncbi:hypothetical protein BOX15_Mlig018370g4 [Macrostomum lignano]|uniref:Protein kinase domain-containing protein n=1 Tax=Macrostomum lignano TaxID=282301 RepID=A0A267FMY6_9PLAT|nr:hypothetical protein BOX15_Mlig018370g4 [Macrostomum lignano]
MSMELVGPSIDDIRYFYEPWFSEVGMRTFFNVRTAFMLADQILCRLLVLHRSGFVHHDIKPDNIALGNGRAMNVVYLLDFGFAKQVSNNRPPEWMGSRKFISIDTYSGAKTNYAQDIESWFYLVISFLYDDLPWTDDHLTDLLGDQADENARWNLVSQMKKTWWGDPSEATSLSETFKMIAGLHSKEIPDIKQIMEQLHKRTRDLRAVMRSQDDAQTLNFELANNQSALFKGYMSIRKVLLQIFKLPNIGDNAYLCDAEFRSLLETEKKRICPSLNGIRKTITGSGTMTTTDFGIKMGRQKSMRTTPRTCRASKINTAATVGLTLCARFWSWTEVAALSDRTKSVMYLTGRAACSDPRRLECDVLASRQCPSMPICQRHETMKATGQQSDKSLSSLLCFYLFILDHLLSLSSLVAMIKLHLLQFAFNMKGLLDDQ